MSASETQCSIKKAENGKLSCEGKNAAKHLYIEDTQGKGNTFLYVKLCVATVGVRDFISQLIYNGGMADPNGRMG